MKAAGYLNNQPMALRFLTYSQIVMYATFAACISLAPASLSTNDGFSYFGNHALTVLPYNVGLIVTAFYLYKTAKSLPSDQKLWFLKNSLRAMAPFVVGVGIVPAIGNGAFDIIHRVLGATLFSLELLLGLWFCLLTKSDLLNWLSTVVMIVFGVMALIYLAPAHGLLIQSQLLYQAAFSVLIFRNLNKLLKAGTTVPGR